MAKGQVCEMCGNYVACPACEGYTCPFCGDDLPQDNYRYEDEDTPVCRWD